MSKAILRFDLNDTDDQEKFARAIKADDMCYVLSEHLEWLRQKLKYKLEGDSEAAKALEESRENLTSLMHDNNVDLNEIWT